MVALALVSWTLPALAQTYRCEVNGRTTFQQQPCTDGKRVPWHWRRRCRAGECCALARRRLV